MFSQTNVILKENIRTPVEEMMAAGPFFLQRVLL